MQGLLAQSHFLILQKQMMFSKFPNFTCSFIISSSIISSCWIRQGGSYAPQLCFSKLFDSIKVKNKVFELALICLYCFLILLLVTLFNFMSCFFLSRTPENKTAYPASSTLEGTPHVVNDFVISTSTANVAYFRTDGSTLQVKHFG